MHKFLTQTFIIVLFFFNNAFGEVISKVEIKGNKRISENTILVLGDINIGEDFDSIKLNNSLKKL